MHATHACVQASEAFLQRMVALLVASHYRNTPNDLLLMADAPAHRLFVLLGPLDEAVNALPDVLAVVQACALAAALWVDAQMRVLKTCIGCGDISPERTGAGRSSGRTR